jgi:hypothetical protein
MANGLDPSAPVQTDDDEVDGSLYIYFDKEQLSGRLFSSGRTKRFVKYKNTQGI